MMSLENAWPAALLLIGGGDVELKREASRSMRSKTKALFIFMNFFLLLYPVAASHADPTRIIAKSSAPESYRSVSPPQKDRLILVSVLQVIDAEEILGSLATYDDVATTRPADYLELYNNAGDLLAVSWIDRFGIERLAVDQALVEQSDQLEGVFVLIMSGDSV